MGPNNSRRNFLRTTAAASVGLSLIGTASLANTDTPNDFPGYSSISDSKTDFRAGLKLGKYLNIKGQILDGTTLLPVANAKVEVWFKDANSNWKLKRGYFHTDANGDYSFDGLELGSYWLVEESRAGWVNTTPVQIKVTGTSGFDITGQDFANFELFDISGTKYEDTNGNGLVDAGEQGLAGWTIYIDENENDILDADEKFAITDANGNWSITGLSV